MTLREQRVLIAALVFAVIVPAGNICGQTTPSVSHEQLPLTLSLQSASASAPATDLWLGNQLQSFAPLLPDMSLAPQVPLDFEDPDTKFKVESLMNILRDSKHESWVLAAYPDPKTGQPLIGAGFNLAVSATEHAQSNPLNPYPFIELSSAQVWQAAGLDLARLRSILAQFDRDLKRWKKDKFRRKIRTHELAPELTEEEATRLLRISALQAIYNSRAYCGNFDRLTASQQMAFSQLVFQMGVNLEEFVQFLSAINEYSGSDPGQGVSSPEPEEAHWKTVQRTLIESDWARRYSSRAITVIAMFDPGYDNEPEEAERQVRAILHPHPPHHHRKPHLDPVRAGDHSASIACKTDHCGDPVK